MIRRFAAFAAVLAAACSAPPEEALVGQFFRALAQGDRASAAGVSMVAFPGGPVASWELVESGPEVRGPYRVPELREEERSKTAERDAQFQALDAYRRANREDLEEIAARRDQGPDAALGARLDGISVVWEEHLATRRGIVSSLSELQMALEEERRRTARSLLREAPVDYLSGAVVDREILVRTVEDGGSRDYRFSIIRYDLVNQHGREVPSRWIIAEVEPLPTSG